MLDIIKDVPVVLKPVATHKFEPFHATLVPKLVNPPDADAVQFCPSVLLRIFESVDPPLPTAIHSPAAGFAFNTVCPVTTREAVLTDVREMLGVTILGVNPLVVDTSAEVLT